MSDVVLKLDGVGKKFCRSLKKSLWYGVKDMGSELIGSKKSHGVLRSGEFWANSDISLELKQGETLGLIGHNGAGKTTLLRMINGLIKPDKGRIEVRGRMQALIALGAGFNPILSGRENVYINAAVLGFSKAEIDEKFEAITDFADIGEFIDAPVQTYSSGMAVRLGFAVAAHMDPDILLIDEVLAVGDINFRKKCYGKIREFREKGVGIVLVSHDISTMYTLCDTVLYLSKGRPVKIGRPQEVIEAYCAEMVGVQEPLTPGKKRAKPAGLDSYIADVELFDRSGQPVTSCATGDYLKVVIHYSTVHPITEPVFGIGLSVPGANGSYLTACNSKASDFSFGTIANEGSVSFEIDSMPLYPGQYGLVVTMGDAYGLRFDSWEGAGALKFNVDAGKIGAGEFYTAHTWSLVS